MISQEQKGDEAVLRLMTIILVVLFNCVDRTGLSGRQVFIICGDEIIKRERAFPALEPEMSCFFFVSEM